MTNNDVNAIAKTNQINRRKSLNSYSAGNYSKIFLKSHHCLKIIPRLNMFNPNQHNIHTS